MFTSQQFRAEIEAFLNRNKKLTPSTFGRLVARDGNLFADIVGGRKPSLRTVERVAAFIEKYDGKLSPERIKQLLNQQIAVREGLSAARHAAQRSNPIRKVRRIPAGRLRPSP
jgi:hypothetical protein